MKEKEIKELANLTAEAWVLMGKAEFVNTECEQLENEISVNKEQIAKLEALKKVTEATENKLKEKQEELASIQTDLLKRKEVLEKANISLPIDKPVVRSGKL